VRALNNGRAVVEPTIHEEKGDKISLQQLKRPVKFSSLNVLASYVCRGLKNNIALFYYGYLVAYMLDSKHLQLCY